MCRVEKGRLIVQRRSGYRSYCSKNQERRAAEEKKKKMMMMMEARGADS